MSEHNSALLIGGIAVAATIYYLMNQPKTDADQTQVKQLKWQDNNAPLNPAQARAQMGGVVINHDGYTANKLQMRYTGLGLAPCDEDQIVDRIGIQHIARAYGERVYLPINPDVQSFISSL